MKELKVSEWFEMQGDMVVFIPCLAYKTQSYCKIIIYNEIITYYGFLS